tara:strand:+ start:695 stop:1585 length:891 start_codon:yes stop_codon:yes gene_type:complete
LLLKIFILISLICSATGRDKDSIPDFRGTRADLKIPPLVEGKSGPGIRTKARNFGDAKGVYHVLYLPKDWKSGKKYPVIVEYAGNGPYRDKNGDVSSGHVEGSKLGYGFSGGKGYIWLCLPYLNSSGTENVRKWWGDAPDYDPMPTVEYCKLTVRRVCEEFGGDEKKIILCGFSRGAIACNFIGLYDDEIARLWAGFIPFSHYDGVRKWAYPDSDRKSAISRIARLKGRPQLILSESPANNLSTRKYIQSLKGINTDQLTFMNSGFRNHNDEWVLRPSEARSFARQWLKSIAPVSE